MSTDTVRRQDPGRAVAALARRAHALVRYAWAARAFSDDRSVILLAAAVWVGASRPHGAPVVAAVVAVAVAFAGRRPVLVVLAVAVLSGALAQQALDGARPSGHRSIDAEAVLASDPDDAFGAVTAVVRAEGHRYEIRARGAPAGHLRRALAGEVVSVVGRVRPRRSDDDRLLVEHVVGTIDAQHVRVTGPGDPLSRAANAYRRLLDRGAASLDPATRALFSGFVLGDDRFQDETTIDDFRATGLSHLLAVSGQNLAFVLVLLGPLLSRFGLRGRLAVTVAAVSMFALMTRFEPSVLRASAMAGVAVLGAALGRRVAPLRVLSLAVAGLVLVDPLLIGSFGFRLSVAASAGIIVLSPLLLVALPGPRFLAELLSVTIAAQAAVAPLLVSTPSGVPLVAVPANVLAVPAAGPLMMWGLTAGPVAGVLGGAVAAVAHVPTRLLLWWIAGTSARFASLPVGRLGVPHLVALAVLAAALLLVRHRRAVVDGSTHPWMSRVGIVAAAAVGVTALVPGQPAPGTRVQLGLGAELWLAEGGASAVVVDGRAVVGSVLAGLRASRLRTVDVIVVRTASRSSAGVVRAIQERFGPATVVAPDGFAQPEAVVPEHEIVLRWDGLAVRVRPFAERLVVEVHLAHGVEQRARGPPVSPARGPTRRRRLSGAAVSPGRRPCLARPGTGVASPQ